MATLPTLRVGGLNGQALKRENSGPKKFVQFLERRGPIFIKIGQFLALRPDIIPQEYCDELLKLVDRVPPSPWRAVEEILTQELGRSPAEVFPGFNRRPVAAGSLAQVYMARLKDGTEVAVKVQRPNLEAALRRDLERAKFIARVLEASGKPFIVSPSALVEEVRGWLVREIDFRQELANMERLGELADGSLIQRIPMPYRAYSTTRVLTAEYLRGIPISSVLQELRADRPGRAPGIAVRGFNPKVYAERLLTATLMQIFRYQFFHADLHPGNLLVLPGDVVGFVDFGLCDELAGPVREKQFHYLNAIYSEEQSRIFNALTEILIPSELTDMERFHREFLEEARKLEGQSQTARERKIDQSPFAQYLVGVMRAARRNGLQVPAGVLSMYRALLTVESLANQLGFTEGLREVGKRFFAELQREELVENLSSRENIERVFFSLLNLKRDAPGQLQQILSEVSEGNFTLKTETTESSRTARSRNQRTRLLAVTILSVSVSLLLAQPNWPRFLGISLSWPLFAALVTLYLWAFLLWTKL